MVVVMGEDIFGLGPTGSQNKNLFSIPGVPNINKLLNPLPEEYDVHERLNRQVPEVSDLLQQRLNSLKGKSIEVPFFANNASEFHIPAQTSSFNPFWQISLTGGVGNNLFGSQAVTAKKGEKVKTDTQAAIDDALYKLPYNPNLELGDGLLETLGANAEDLFQADNRTKKEEEDVILEQIKNEYGFEDIKDTMEEGNVPENIYVFYGGESDNFYKALEFVGLSPMNREF